MTIASLRSRALVATLLASFAAPVAAQTGYPAPTTAYPAIADVDPVAALSRYLRMLAANPRDLASLTGAGRAALAVGDANAALGFYARAEEIAPRNGRIKAGLATALVQMEQPRTALKLFDEAVVLGVPVTEIASDRGLASDLLGDGRRAQADYTLGLRAKDDDETLRRLALSMAISGDRAGALTMLDPLLRKRDGGAVRARAFVLALTGDQAGAASVVRAAMPAAQASVMANFMTRLARLNPAQKALAVNFGYFPSDGRTYSAAELFADSRSATPSPGAGARDTYTVRRADTPLIPQGVPLGTPGALASTDADARAPRRRPGQIEAAIEVMPPPHVLLAPVPGQTPPPAVARVVTAAPVAAGQVATRVPSGTLNGASAAAARTGTSPSAPVTTPTPMPSVTAGATLSGPSALPAPSSVAPVKLATAEEAALVDTAGIAGAAPSSMPVSSAADQGAAPAAPASSGIATTADKPAPATPAQAHAAPAAGGLIVTARGPALTGGPVAQVKPAVATATAARPVILKPAPPTRLAMAGEPATARPSAHKAVEDGAIAVAKGKVGASSEKPALAARAGKGSEKGGKALTAKEEAAGDVPKAGARGGKTKSADKADDKPPAVKGKSDAKGKLADKSKADAKSKISEKADKVKSAEKAKADAKADAKASAKSKVPERYWVQVASGSNKANLDRAWDDVRGKAPKLLNGKTTYTSPWRASNRLLIGPFKTDGEAQAQVNKLAKAGVSGIQFTTRAGNDVEKVAGR